MVTTYYYNGFKNHKLSQKLLNSIGKSYKLEQFHNYYICIDLDNPKNFIIYKEHFEPIQIYEKPKISNYAFIVQNFKLYYDQFLYFKTREEIKSFYNPLPIYTNTYFYDNADFFLSLGKDLIPYLNIKIYNIELITPETKYGIDFLNGSIPLNIYTDLLKQSDLINYIQKEPL